MQIPRELIEQLSNATGSSFKLKSTRSIGGGSINQAMLISDDKQAFFVKFNRASLLEMFHAESEGLKELQQADAIRVPDTLCHGSNQQYSWLVLEKLDLGHSTANSRLAGEQLAALHCMQQPGFGWHMDNTIGSSPQINTSEQDWEIFWKQHRLGYQLKLAIENGYHGDVIKKTENLVEKCGAFLNHRPAASLLHGDLWSGNLSYDSQGQPVIFDPAVYYGDRETDLAMTELFGGFGQNFYQAYKDSYPLEPGYPVRKKLYNLYHVLNHMNLFGGGYRQQAVSLCDSLLSELR